MAKKTLLQITQDILGAMEDDEVNSISDTVSSLDVARTVVSIFDEIAAQLEFPANDTLIQLESLSDVNRPNYLRMTDNIKQIHWFKYNNKDVKYLSPREFVDMIFKRDEGVDVEDFGGITFKILSDKDPDYWTTFDDEYIVTDSFLIDDGSTLLSNKSACWAAKTPTLEMSDEAIPDLPTNLFPLLISRSIARCFVNFKQVANSEEASSARQTLVRHQNVMFRHNNRKYSGPNYGKPRR